MYFNDPIDRQELKLMKKESFIEALQEIMELEDSDINEDTVLTDLIEFNSLAIMGIIALIDENFDLLIKAEKFEEVTTVKDLMNLVGGDKFK